jgi:hypothetical protein
MGWLSLLAAVKNTLEYLPRDDRRRVCAIIAAAETYSGPKTRAGSSSEGFLWIAKRTRDIIAGGFNT